MRSLIKKGMFILLLLTNILTVHCLYIANGSKEKIGFRYICESGGGDSGLITLAKNDGKNINTCGRGHLDMLRAWNPWMTGGDYQFCLDSDMTEAYFQNVENDEPENNRKKDDLVLRQVRHEDGRLIKRRITSHRPWDPSNCPR